ncbi:MAG: LysR family transcriptional regulator [Pseudomonadota bacterium]
MTIDWNDLKLAAAVAREGSLSKAARVLGIDQSTVGRRLTALEAGAGATLFVRTRAGVALTEAGQHIVDLATEMEARVGLLPELLGEGEDGVQGPIRIEGERWALARLVAVGVEQLTARHPGLSLHVIGADGDQGVWQGEPQLGVRFQQASTSGAFAIKLGAIPHALFRHVDAHEGALQLAVHEHVHSDRSTFTDANAALQRAALGRVFTANCITMLAAAVATGRFQALLPTYLGEEDPHLARVSSGPQGIGRDLYVHAHPDTIGSRRVQAVIEWLRSVFDDAFLATP